MPPIFKTAFVLILFAAPALADDAPTYRELPCRVVDEDGEPVRNLNVELYGVDRYSRDPEDDIPREPGWRFTTDNDGCFTARFGKFHIYQHLRDDAYRGPDYGHFHFARRVGSRFVNGIWVRDGDLIGGIWSDGDPTLAPGRYDFKVRQKQPGE